jgi:hypothetical protein
MRLSYRYETSAGVPYVDRPGKGAIPSGDFQEKHVRKEARYGFQGTVADNEGMVAKVLGIAAIEGNE